MAETDGSKTETGELSRRRSSRGRPRQPVMKFPMLRTWLLVDGGGARAHHGWLGDRRAVQSPAQGRPPAPAEWGRLSADRESRGSLKETARKSSEQADI